MDDTPVYYENPLRATRFSAPVHNTSQVWVGSQGLSLEEAPGFGGFYVGLGRFLGDLADQLRTTYCEPTLNAQKAVEEVQRVAQRPFRSAATGRARSQAWKGTVPRRGQFLVLPGAHAHEFLG